MSTTAIKIHLGLQVCDKADKGKVSHCWSLICRSTASSESHRDTARPVNPFQTTLFSHSILLLYNNTRTAARGWQEWQQDTEDASLDKLGKLFHHFSFHLEFLFSNAEKFPAVPVQGKVRKEMALKWNVPETFQIWSRKVSKYPDKKSWGICKCWLLFYFIYLLSGKNIEGEIIECKTHFVTEAPWHLLHFQPLWVTCFVTTSFLFKFSIHTTGNGVSNGVCFGDPVDIYQWGQKKVSIPT